MERWISHSIAPLGVIFLLTNIIIFFSADYISRKILKLANYLLMLVILFYLLIGIFSIVLALTQVSTNEYILSHWNLLSSYSKIYYYNNDIAKLFETFYFNMILTGSFYLILFLSGFFLIVLIFIYNERIDIYWRPPLRSKLRDERAERYIQHYSHYDKDYKKVMKNEENVLSENIIKSEDNNNNNENANLLSKQNLNEKNFVKDDLSSNNLSGKNNPKENQDSKELPYKGNMDNVIKENNELKDVNNEENLMKNNTPIYNKAQNNSENKNELINSDEIKEDNQENNNYDAKSVPKSNFSLDPKNLPKRTLRKRKTNIPNEQENNNN